MNRKYLAHGSRIYGENCEEYPEAFNHSENKDHCTLGLKERENSQLTQRAQIKP